MATVNVGFKGADEFLEALKRNPETVLRETRNYFTRGLAIIKSAVNNNPWRVGGLGGGVPVKTENLKKAHRSEITSSYGHYYVDENKADYAKYVYGGTRKMDARPWLEYAKSSVEKKIEELQDQLLVNITKDLAS